jgi:hypothetical protein
LVDDADKRHHHLDLVLQDEHDEAAGNLDRHHPADASESEEAI